MPDQSHTGAVSRGGFAAACAIALALALGPRMEGAEGPSRADLRDPAFVEGLRERRLFQLVEAFCRERLGDEQLSQVERGRLVVEQIRNYADYAVHSAPQDRAPLWRKASEAAALFARQNANHPLLFLVQFQDALAVLAQGELLRQEAEVAAATGEGLAPSRDAIRQAARLLEQLDKQLRQAIAVQRRPPLDEGALTTDELFSLQYQMQRQLARAYRNQALCYPENSDDRVASLTLAIQQLEKPLTQLPLDDPLLCEIQLDQILCHRLLRDLAGARRIAAALDQSSAKPPIQLRARAEAIRVELAGENLDEALKILSRGREINGAVSPELDFASLETYAALWRRAQDAADDAASKRWRDESVAMVRLIVQAHGSYWARRAELLLVGSAPKKAAQEDLELLARSADQLYLQGLLDQAIAAYEQGGRLAQEKSESDRAFELFYKAALVEQQRGGREQLVGRLRRLAVLLQSHPQAGQAHFLAIAEAVELARNDGAKAGLYEELLREHLANWPRGAAADNVRLWLGRCRESRSEWSDAIALYEDVSPTSDQAASAVEAASRCWLSWLRQLPPASPAHQETAAAAVRFFERIVERCKDRQEPAMLAAVAAQAAVLLRHSANGHQAAEQKLLDALKNSPKAPASWKAWAQCLLVVALAGQAQRCGEAGAVLGQIEDGSPQTWLEMLADLSVLGDAAAPSAAVELGKLRVSAAERLRSRRQELDEQDRRMLERMGAAALAAAGRRSEALEAYATLAKQFPRDGDLQEAHAQLLLAGEGRQTLEDALRQWRRVAQGSRVGSERWYRAKYSVALAQFKLGDKAEAAQLVRYVQAVAGLDNTKEKAKYLELLERCQRP